MNQHTQLLVECAGLFKSFFSSFKTKDSYILQTSVTIFAEATLFGREKLIHREAKSFKKLAGVVFGRYGCTFIVGNTEVDYGNDKLYFSFEAYNGK